MNKWNKISDKLPESMQQVLLYDANHKDYAVGIYNKNYNAIQIGAGMYGIGDVPFTHWSALPDPPNCKNCKWHDDFSCVCSNGYSDECADFTDNNFYCEYWEEKE